MRESIRERSNMNTNEANGIKLVDGLMPRLIAIDHGWSSIKTPNFIFENGIKELKTMPATKENVLEYRGKIYVVAIMDTINAGLKRYALEVEAKLRELKIDFDFTNVVYVGGGAGVMRRFGSCTGDNVRYVTDVRANALGYQYLAQNLV